MLSKEGKIKTCKGFTFLEVIVAVAIFSLLMVAVSGIFGNAFKSYRNTQAIQKDMENAQFAMNQVAKILRESEIVDSNATNPSNFVTIYDPSQGICIKYRFNSDKLQSASKSAGVVSASDCELPSWNPSSFSDITSGYVTGNFGVVKSDPDNKIVGRITVSMEVCATAGCSGSSKDRARIQTTVSLRSAAVINTSFSYYTWATTDCSVPCGGGTMNTVCRDASGEEVGDLNCTGERPNISCNPQTCSCTLWGGTIASGQSVSPVYEFSSVPCGSSCVSQTRTCNNGTLSGTYTNKNCSVQPCSTCGNGICEVGEIAAGCFDCSSRSATAQCSFGGTTYWASATHEFYECPGGGICDKYTVTGTSGGKFISSCSGTDTVAAVPVGCIVGGQARQCVFVTGQTYGFVGPNCTTTNVCQGYAAF